METPLPQNSESVKATTNKSQVVLLALLLLAIVGALGYMNDQVSWFGPPSSEIAAAINGSLGQRISGGGRLFTSYRISNKYTKMARLKLTVQEQKWYIYEYVAVCPVSGGFREFSGTVALSEQGSKWIWRNDIQ